MLVDTLSQNLLMRIITRFALPSLQTMIKRTHLLSNQANCVYLTTRSKKLKKMEMRELSLH